MQKQKTKKQAKTFFRKRHKVGHLSFTLIELLIVISIMGILASMFLVSFGSFGARARDAARKQDLHSLQVALESYYIEHGTYNVADSGYAYEPDAPLGGGNGWVSLENGTTYLTAITRRLYQEGFLSLPLLLSPSGSPSTVEVGISDVPTQGKHGYMLYVCDDGQAYSLSAYLEKPSDEDRLTMCKSCQATEASFGQAPPYWGKNYAIMNREYTPNDDDCP